MLALKNMNDFIVPVLFELYNEQKKKLTVMHELNKEMDVLLIQDYNDLCKKYICLQKSGAKNSAAVISFHYLKSSILSRTFEFQINIYDKQMYADKNEVLTYWVPILEKSAFEEDMDIIKKRAQANIVHFGYTQMQEIRMKYANMYFFLVGKYLKSLVTDMINQPAFIELEKENDFMITFGAYMDKVLPIYRIGDSVV